MGKISMLLNKLSKNKKSIYCKFFLGSLVLFVIFIFTFLYWLSSPVRGKYDKPPQSLIYVRCDKIMPLNATGIEFVGKRAFGWYLSWKCNTSEEDFISLAKNNEWLLEPTIGNVNFLGVLSFYKPEKRGSPTSAWFYNKRNPNGGGISIMYDRTTNTLYGQMCNY